MNKLLAILIQVTVTYFYLLLIVRIAGKRAVDKPTPFDFMVSLMIGEFPDDVIWGKVPLAQGLVAMGTLMLLHLLVAYVTYRSLPLSRLFASVPAPLLIAGQTVRASMDRERLNEEELDALLREEQIEERAVVREGVLEPNGMLSVQYADDHKPAEKRDLPTLQEVLA